MQCLGFDLANALSGYAELLPHFLQGATPSVLKAKS